MQLPAVTSPLFELQVRSKSEIAKKFCSRRASPAGGEEAMAPPMTISSSLFGCEKDYEPVIYMAVTFYAGTLCLLHITLPLPPH